MDPRSDFRALAGAVLACEGIGEAARLWWTQKLQALKVTSLFGSFWSGNRS